VASPNFQSIASGLCFVVLAAANSFGPMLRFAFRADFAARHITKQLGLQTPDEAAQLAPYSERSASTAFTLAARAAGTADAITAASKITMAEARTESAPG
jgi:hypothetical protein